MTRSGTNRRYLAAAMAVLGLLMIAVPGARAQAVYGSIAGTVADSTGAAVPGAAVTITSAQRQTTDSVVTNASGYFE